MYYEYLIKDMDRMRKEKIAVIAGNHGVGKTTFVKNYFEKLNMSPRYININNSASSLSLATSNIGGLRLGKKNTHQNSYELINDFFNKVKSIALDWRYIGIMVSILIATIIPAHVEQEPLLLIGLVILLPWFLLIIIIFFLSLKWLKWWEYKDRKITIIDNLDRITYQEFLALVRIIASKNNKRKFILIFDLKNISERYREEYGFEIRNPMMLLEKYFDNILNIEFYTNFELENINSENVPTHILDFVNSLSSIGFTNIRILEKIFELENNNRQHIENLNLDGLFYCLVKLLSLLDPKLYTNLSLNYTNMAETLEVDIKKYNGEFQISELLKKILNSLPESEKNKDWNKLYFMNHLLEDYDKKLKELSGISEMKTYLDNFEDINKDPILRDIFRMTCDNFINYRTIKYLFQIDRMYLRKIFDNGNPNEIDEYFTNYEVDDYLESAFPIMYAIYNIKIFDSWFDHNDWTNNHLQRFIEININKRGTYPNLFNAIEILLKYIRENQKIVSKTLMKNNKKNEYDFSLVWTYAYEFPNSFRNIFHNFQLDTKYLTSTISTKDGKYSGVDIAILEELGRKFEISLSHLLKWPDMKFLWGSEPTTREKILKHLNRDKS